MAVSVNMYWRWLRSLTASNAWHVDVASIQLGLQKNTQPTNFHFSPEQVRVRSESCFPHNPTTLDPGLAQHAGPGLQVLNFEKRTA